MNYGLAELMQLMNAGAPGAPMQPDLGTAQPSMALPAPTMQQAQAQMPQMEQPQQTQGGLQGGLSGSGPLTQNWSAPTGAGLSAQYAPQASMGHMLQMLFPGLLN